MLAGFFTPEMNYIFFNTIPGMVIQSSLFPLVIGILYIIVRFIIRKKNKMSGYKNEVIYLLFVCYIAEVIALVLIPSYFFSYVWSMIIYGWFDPGAGLSLSGGGFNFIPSFYKVITGELSIGPWVRSMIIGNVLMFIPFGIMYPLIKREKDKIFRQMIICSFVFILGIEVVQPFVGRSFDVDDIICNLLGVVVGYGILKLVRVVKAAIWSGEPPSGGRGNAPL